MRILRLAKELLMVTQLASGSPEICIQEVQLHDPRSELLHHMALHA